MSEDKGQIAEILPELAPKPEPKVAEVKAEARRKILDNIVSLLDLAYKKGHRIKQTKEQQRWFTIFGYLAQVSTRIVRDLEYEALRSELDALKKQVLNRDGVRLRRAILASRDGAPRRIMPDSDKSGHSD